MSFFAFLAPMPTVAAKIERAKKLLPVFKARWWFKPDRLDARSVIWSLYNHPEEWRFTHEGNPNLTITHIPSKHEFWCCRTMGFRFYQADCGCSMSSRKWQMFQREGVAKAMRHWKRWHHQRENVSEHFQSHFIH